jgi:glutathione synthase/RimK-type ligase-like ATP-grasp enzyme
LTARSVVIVGDSGDIHVERVAKLLRERNIPVFRIDLDCFPRCYDLSLTLAGDGWAGEIHCKRTHSTLDARQVRSVWVRKPAQFAFSAALSGQEEAFAREEANHCLLGWLNSLDCFFMSHPTALRGASWKLEQLVRAQRFGFEVPKTLLSNMPGAARAFIRAGGDGTIYKTLSSASLASEKVPDADRTVNGLHTTAVAADDPDIESIAVLPAQIQHYVEKAYEIRATIVAQDVFAVGIDSQSNPRTRIDFRHFDADVAFSAIHLPAVLVERCRDFVASYGLSYGAIDLIATPEGRYVFLENNPVGQFVFIEELVPEVEISRAVAGALEKGRGE